MSAVFKREFSSYMRNVTGPLFIALLLMFDLFKITLNGRGKAWLWYSAKVGY